MAVSTYIVKFDEIKRDLIMTKHSSIEEKIETLLDLGTGD